MARGLPTMRPKYHRGYSIAVVEGRPSRQDLALMVVTRLRVLEEKPVGVGGHLYDSVAEGAQAR